MSDEIPPIPPVPAQEAPRKLSYVSLPPPPIRKRPYAFLAVMIGVLPVAAFFVSLADGGESDPNHLPILYTLRGLAYAWVATVAGTIWIFRDDRRRARVWLNARVNPDDLPPPEEST